MQVNPDRAANRVEDAEEDALAPFPLPIPIPSSQSVPTTRGARFPLMLDDRAIGNLIDIMFARSGLTKQELSRRMGLKGTTIHQYFSRRRVRPSINWMIRFCEACGGRLWAELPESR